MILSTIFSHDEELEYFAASLLSYQGTSYDGIIESGADFWLFLANVLCCALQGLITRPANQITHRASSCFLLMINHALFDLYSKKPENRDDLLSLSQTSQQTSSATKRPNTLF